MCEPVELKTMNLINEHIDQKKRYINKVVFVDRPYWEIKSSFLIKGYRCTNGANGDVYRTQYTNGKRYIDQFDYVSFINSLEKGETMTLEELLTYFNESDIIGENKEGRAEV